MTILVHIFWSVVNSALSGKMNFPQSNTEDSDENEERRGVRGFCPIVMTRADLGGMPRFAA